MKNTIFYLSTCDTCQKILKEIGATNYDFEMQDIKTNPVTASQLAQLKTKAGNYEALFSKRAQLYKSLGLAEKNLQEDDYKHYLLEHYTFLKRPVIVWKGSVFAGNDKKTIAAVKQALG
ncbi:MAG TPA: ArsC/Spx/MgsR family protein [Flavipsychrobacter sp.]|nr:ArsC/Spx/MgsR family protein [Flavipsychrobacter sp.]